ncbi:MAG: indolepyruvate ferredoxin oxidoreductase subunit alpha [Coriobacteriales bacterium]|jgi:indolepyruvate ferredoxin oxidoreductase alpha subunit|nr:indolepyruvate ferredoxin oxidoreductase subunit alpha [Coriobacteriales bacterium]
MSLTLCMGNQALAFAALNAGVNVVSGYPGTPSSEVLQTISEQVIARKLTGIHVEWSTNEKVALEVGAGAAFAGARALVTMKQVGLNVASDALMSLPYLGVKGGLVLIVADDPGPISSQTEQDTRQFATFAKVPVLDPSTPEEAYEMVKSAFELSERHKTPVIVRPTTRICHGTVPMAADISYTPHRPGGFERNGRWVVLPRRAFEGHLEIHERLPRVAAEFSTSPFNTLINTHPNAPSHLGIVAGGISYAYLHDALARLNQRDPFDAPGPLRLLKIGTPFPFPEQRVLEFLDGLSEVLVLEELEPVIERSLLQLIGKHRLPVKLLGKLTGDTPQAGEDSVSLIMEKVGSFCGVPVPAPPIDVTPAGGGSAATAGAASPPALPARPPVLCAGCPHRASFYAVKRALRGREAVFSGDIGCYTLGNALPLEMVDTCICMGGGFTIPQGLNWAQPDVLHLGFVGDSTFFASGLTGVSNAVYNNAKVTLCVLNNATTAMTGSQPHPGTGKRMGLSAAENDAQHALRIPDILRALGVKQVAEVNPFELSKAIEAVRTAVDFDGVSAIVFNAPCVTVAPPGPQPTIDDERCTNCKSCIRSIGCPALVVRGGQVVIDATLCYGCGLCVDLCPVKAIQHTQDTKPEPPSKAKSS